jgi:hypothetical protein
MESQEDCSPVTCHRHDDPGGGADLPAKEAPTVNVIQTYFDCEPSQQLVPCGTPLELWDASLTLSRRGEWASIVAPGRGRLDALRKLGSLVQLDYSDTYCLPLDLGADAAGRRWVGDAEIPLTTTAHWLPVDGVDLYFLSNEVLDRAPGRPSPAPSQRAAEQRQVERLAFQVDTVRFVRSFFGCEQAEIRAHEPYDPFLLPAGFATDRTKQVVSTVQGDQSAISPEHRGLVARLMHLLVGDDEAEERAVAG